jgi:hypothetical protein
LAADTLEYVCGAPAAVSNTFFLTNLALQERESYFNTPEKV